MSLTHLGVGIVGTGFGQKVHIPGFQEHPKIQPVAVYNPSLQKAQTVAEAHGIPQAFGKLEELLALPDVKAVSISTPPFLHYEMAKMAIEAGKHVLLEKPAALHASEVKDLLQRAQKQGVVTCLDFEFRYVPAWMRLAELMEDQYVGQTRLIKVDWLVAGRADPNRPWNWYSSKRLGGGALGAFGSHTFDYVAWLFGPASSICAQLSTGIQTRPDPRAGDMKAVDSDDTCRIWLDLADGTPCQIVLSAVAYQGRGHWVEVYGDRGTLILGSDNQTDYVHGFRLWGSQGGEPLEELTIPTRLQFGKTYPDGRIAPFIRVVDHWVKDIEQQQATAPSLQEGLYSQQLMDLAHESNEKRCWLDVPSLSSHA